MAKKSGVYYIYVINCGSSQVRVKGKATLKNYFGFASAEKFPQISFLRLLSALYFFLVLLWCFASFQNRKNLVLPQFSVAVIIVMGMLETTLRYVSLLHYNQFGRQNHFLFLFALLISSLKKTFNRQLVTFFLTLLPLNL